MKRWVIFTEQEAQTFLAIKRQRTWWGIDCETEGLNPKEDSAAGPKGVMVCFTLASASEEAFVWVHNNESVKKLFKPWLEFLPVIGHNLHSFDWHQFNKAGIPLKGSSMDTLRMHRLLRTESGIDHRLKSLLPYWVPDLRLPGEFMDLFSKPKVNKKGKVTKSREIIPISKIPVEHRELLPLLIEYAIVDARGCYELAKLLKDRLCTEICTTSIQDLWNLPSKPSATWSHEVSRLTSNHTQTVVNVPTAHLKNMSTPGTPVVAG